MRVLIVAHTTSSWGGVQEWALTLIQGLTSRGHQVGVMTPNQKLIRETELVGAMGMRSDLGGSDLPACLEWFSQNEWDVIVTSPMRSREVAQYFHRETGVPFVATFHGVHTDYVYAWKNEARALVAVTGSLARMITQIGGKTPGDIAVIPNGVPESELERPQLTLEDKMDDGPFKIALASRLEIDKLRQLEVLDNTVGKLTDLGVGPIHATMMGDGSARGYFNSYLGQIATRHSNFTYTLAGWLDLPGMLTTIESSVLSLAAGRTALHSLAVGTPVIGVGARKHVGLVAGDRMQETADSNFGDYFTASGFKPATDLSPLLDRAEYSTLSTQGRDFIRRRYTARHMVESFEELLLSLI